MYLLANWKLNGSIKLLQSFISHITDEIIGDHIKIILALPYHLIDRAVTMNISKNIFIAAQNISIYQSGAYTGEVSANMLKEIGCIYCLIGHSERKKYFSESNEDVYKKTLNALNSSLKPIICIGEKKRETYIEELKIICNTVFSKLLNAGEIIVAYEPVWAIGSDQIPTIEDINSSILEIKGNTFMNNPFLYGGSVSDKNIEYLLKSNFLNGFLIGGASLNIKKFINIIKIINKYTKNKNSIY